MILGKHRSNLNLQLYLSVSYSKTLFLKNQLAKSKISLKISSRKVSFNKVKGIPWSWNSCGTLRSRWICINKFFRFFIFDTMVLTKVVREYIIVSLLCHKSTGYDDTLHTFLFHNTRNKYPWVNSSTLESSWEVWKKL